MKCSNCGDEFSLGYNFCPHCGESTSLDQNNPENLTNKDETYCQTCGVKAPQGAEFCPACGERIAVQPIGLTHGGDSTDSSNLSQYKKVSIKIMRRKKVVKVAGLVSALLALLSIICLYTPNRFYSFYQIVSILIAIILGFVCLRESSYDKELLAGSYSILALSQLYSTFTGELKASNLIINIIIILANLLIAAYIIGININKITTLGGAIILFGLKLKVVFDLVKIFQNIKDLEKSLPAAVHTLTLTSQIKSMTGVLVFAVPALVMILLIASNSIIIRKN